MLVQWIYLKGKNGSYEGRGLSISTEPDAWKY